MPDPQKDITLGGISLDFGTTWPYVVHDCVFFCLTSTHFRYNKFGLLGKIFEDKVNNHTQNQISGTDR